MPFIKNHLARFAKLSTPWHWHLVEGVAELKHDTSWSVRSGGRVSEVFHNDGLSIDGTSEYLDEIASEFPGQVSIYRKSRGSFWEGKREMVAAPLSRLPDDCLLWQVDVDEFWHPEQLSTMLTAFTRDPDKTAAWYWCNFHVGERLVVCTRNCYSQDPSQEWLRTWRYKSGDKWASHEPPVLTRGHGPNAGRDVGVIDCFDQNATESLGAVFDHFAYIRKSQLDFKQTYYGYRGAVAGWERLQRDGATMHYPLKLADYFPWVKDSTYVGELVSAAARSSIYPHKENSSTGPMILLDASVFAGGVSSTSAQVWARTLHEWVRNGLSPYILVLNQDGLCPEIPGINRIPSPIKMRRNLAQNRRRLQKLCDETLTEVFVTAGEVTPAGTPSVRVETDIETGIMQVFVQDRKSKRLALPRQVPPLPCYMSRVLSSHPPDSNGSEVLQNETTLAQFAMELHEEIALALDTSIAIHSRRRWHRRSVSQNRLIKWRRVLTTLKQQLFGFLRSRMPFVAP